jgi:PAS domain-containing protein
VESDLNSLTTREKLFRTLTENSTDIIARFDKGFRHVYINPAIEKYSNLKPTSFLSLPNKTRIIGCQYLFGEEEIKKEGLLLRFYNRFPGVFSLHLYPDAGMESRLGIQLLPDDYAGHGHPDVSYWNPCR